MDLHNIPISEVKGITKNNLPLFTDKLKINNLSDLILFLPRNYEDKTSKCFLSEAILGNKVNVDLRVLGKYIRELSRFKKQLILTAQDQLGDQAKIIFFQSADFFYNQIEPEKYYTFFGAITKPKHYGDTYLLSHPEIVRGDTSQYHSSTLTPIYRGTKGLKQPTIRKVVNNALEMVEKLGFEELKPKNGFPPYEKHLDLSAPVEQIDFNQFSVFEAIKSIHNPPHNVSATDIKNGNHTWIMRLVLEELLAKQLALLNIKRKNQALIAPRINPNSKLVDRIIANLPYQLTKAQFRVYGEINQDLQKQSPMLRLVQGDVGCGKTMVAMLAIAQVVDSGYQAALMAPTYILAQQLYMNMQEAFAPFGIKTVFVNGRLTQREKRLVNEQIKSGEVQIIVGTHAVYSEWLEYHNLGLVVIDEQHRFGVEQRLAISQKQETYRVHTLMMSATPAPRSIGMTLYADLDLSIVDELPPGRIPVRTLMYTNRYNVIARLRANIIENQRQIYWVCSLIEENNELAVQSAEEAFELLREQIPEARIGLIHGKMKDIEKEAVMLKFKAHDLDILVATTVIEVGVNVPNASLMIIENPERLGLSQIHQLRGRVGRGSKESFCVLLLGEKVSQSTRERLDIFTLTNDGFEIAEKDLELRGIGDILGTNQSGEVEFQVADINRDSKLLTYAHNVALEIFEHEPELANKIISRWKMDHDYTLA